MNSVSRASGHLGDDVFDKVGAPDVIENSQLNTAKNNGNIHSRTITVPTVGSSNGFTAVQTYNYDSLNRIDDATEMVTPAGSSTATQSWKQDYSFDRFGNRNFDEANTTKIPKNCGTSPNLTVCPADRRVFNPSIAPSTNRINLDQDGDSVNDYAFDSSGNTTRNPQMRRFTYDAENKQTKVETVDANGNVTGTIGQYWFDGDGRRVKKIAYANNQPTETTVFVYDASSRLVAEYSTILNETPQVAYLTNDHLGSPRINTDENGAVIARHDYHPYGEEVTERTHLQYAADTIRKQFTGYERDTETDLDFAQARMYAKTLGRFTTPDEAFADQHEEYPQSWNLFAIVRNNPPNLVDPLGSNASCPPRQECVIDENGKEISEDEPLKVETKAPECSANNPCRVELPDSSHDWIPAWGSFRRMIWNIRCQGTGGCDFDKALYYFGRTSLELTPLGWAMRGAKAAQAAPSILQKLCFEEGTLVLTEDGLKPIEEIKAGDKVLSYDERTKQTEYKTVLQAMVREAEAGRLLSLKVEGEAKPLGVTGEHPFYVRVHGARSNLSSDDDDGKWIEAKHLQTGDEIRKADGTWARVESIEKRKDGGRVYNFTVEDNHSYFVGQTNLLVHNGICDIVWKKVMTSKEVIKMLK